LSHEQNFNVVKNEGLKLFLLKVYGPNSAKVLSMMLRF